MWKTSPALSRRTRFRYSPLIQVMTLVYASKFRESLSITSVMPARGP